jgi:UDPglucose 6-dehydrogenase
MITRITCIGAGYVGGPTMSVIADKCPHITVTVVDSNPERIEAWNSDNLPVYEPGLFAVVRRARGINLHFSSDIEAALKDAQCVFISVNTPTKTSGEGAGMAADLTHIESCSRIIARHAPSGAIIVEKSTVPVKAAERVKEVLAQHGQGKVFSVLSNPEFLAEGTAIADMENPERVLIGGDHPEPIELLAGVYSNWVPSPRILRTKLWSAEMAKLVANAFLAQRVSSINAVSAFCEATGADVDEVAKAIGMDSRIGAKFLKAGAGFGGSCFQKDILNLVYLCQYYGLPQAAAYWSQVLEMNNWQKSRIVRIVADSLPRDVAAPKIAVLGFAFKKNTNDTRESPAIDICAGLISRDINLAIYDPKVSEEQIGLDLGSIDAARYRIAQSVEDACRNAVGVVVLTEWDQFASIDWRALTRVLSKGARVFDARNCTDHAAIRLAGLGLWAVGKPNSL